MANKSEVSNVISGIIIFIVIFVGMDYFNSPEERLLFFKGTQEKEQNQIINDPSQGQSTRTVFKTTPRSNSNYENREGAEVFIKENFSNNTIDVSEISIFGESFTPKLGRVFQEFQGAKKFIYTNTKTLSGTTQIQFVLAPNRDPDGSIISFTLSWYIFPQGKDKMFSDYATTNFYKK
ncbi:hypothetical protein [Algoriphagus aquimarinus]|uniref:hypothetical protein n=1 Tax=Algoriphagus aquimarinus TaxID=237018 RepID=UPI0030DB65AB|tara:strand:- start:5472 stop:6005 length:534 start_codon:yes stop_codon:yes gene_type:complete